jgi:hypothetical protein
MQPGRIVEPTLSRPIGRANDRDCQGRYRTPAPKFRKRNHTISGSTIVATTIARISGSSCFSSFWKDVSVSAVCVGSDDRGKVRGWTL